MIDVFFFFNGKIIMKIIFLDLSGNKAALEERLVKLKDISNKLHQSEAVLDLLSKNILEKGKGLPAKAKEVMERDINNLKYVSSQ